MKSAVFYGNKDMRIVDTTIPVLKDHEVLVQVKACGICGTDVHIFHGDPGAAEVTPPTILGHEFSGVIVEVGNAVTRWKKEDRVCVDPNHPCGECDPCRSGVVHFCEHMIGYGTTMNGGFAQYCAVHESQLYQLADHVSFEQGAMSEPVACCVHGIDLCELHAGSHVVVIGGGMIGLLMIQLARLSGAAAVVCLEPIKEKRDVAKKLGADLTIDPLTEDVDAKLRPFGHIDCVIECVGRTSTIEQAIHIAGYQAIVMMFGLTGPKDEVAIKPFEIFQKELILKSSYINPCTQQRAVDLISSGRLDVSSMIYDVCGLEELPKILSDASLRSKGKFIISPER